jgi:hypothetical protein
VNEVLTAEQAARVPSRMQGTAKFEVWVQYGI